MSQAGWAQALSVATTIPRRPYLIVISPFLRTRQTAEPTLHRFPDVPVRTWPVQEFTYLSPGRCAGTTATQRRVRWMRERLAACPVTFIVVFTHGQIMQACQAARGAPG